MGLLEVTVLVTVLDDPRLDRCLASLLGQTHPPARVLIADGGRSPQIAAICERYARLDPRFVHLHVPGSITQSRNQAIREVTTPLLAFLDTDEVAPPGWLAALVGPLAADERVGFTGGPTPALEGTAATRAARYYDAYLNRFYAESVRERPWAIPMGNSAFRKRLFDELGALVAALPTNGAEDQDFENRAIERGWRAAYVPEAQVAHDYTGLTLRSLLRRQYVYASGAFVVYRRHGRTYEASGTDAVYLLLPAVLIVGGLLAAVPVGPVRLAGELVAIAGAVGCAALLAHLARQGLAGDRQYPGYRYRPWIEPLRKWATMLGALAGLWAQRRAASGRADPPTSGGPATI